VIEADVLIVGGGPAGSACAWQLREDGLDCILLDKAGFPRPKPCAGWVTPQVWRDLQLQPEKYPHRLTVYHSFDVSIHGVRFRLPTRQYAIRRIEFDAWLLGRSGCENFQHKVERIEQAGEFYEIDGMFRSRWLVGAGGTGCPVKRTFFKSSRTQERLIIAQESEFQYPYTDGRCRLWFFEDGLPGYAWYVPKEGGYINIGVGGSAQKLKARGDSLRRHWALLLERVKRLGVDPAQIPAPAGHSYYLRGGDMPFRLGNTLLAGDAAGLATLDMGEGIAAAVRSGLMAARAISRGEVYSFKIIPHFSFPALIGLRGKRLPL